MEENLKNKLGFWSFIFVVIFLLIGGYYITFRFDIKKNDIKENENEKISYKINENKDYIYFENEEAIIDEDGAEVFYKDVILNIKGQESLTETLKKENKIFKKNIKYIDDEESLNKELINYNYNNIYALTFREYKIYEHENYVSLVIDDHNYSCFDLNTFIGTKSYIFDISKGILLNIKEILNIYDLEEKDIVNKVKDKLLNTQKVVDGIDLIKIDETLNDLEYSLFINEYGDLYISFLVKTSQVDYNEIMEV